MTTYKKYKKTTAAGIACLMMLLAAAGCGNEAQSSNEPQVDEDVPVSSSNDGITIKQLPYTVKTSIVGGDKEMMLSVTNNTEFSLTDFQLHYTVKPDLTDEQITEAFSGTEVKIKKLRKNGLTCEVEGFLQKGKKATGECKYEGNTFTDDKQLDVMDPEMITVEYLNTDTSALHTVYYEFASQEMVDDASTSSFDVWPSGSSRASQIPQPTSTYLTNLMDDDLFGLSFSVIGATSADYQQYINDCVDMGWQVESSMGSSTDFAAKDDYTLTVYFYSSSSVLNVSLDPQS